MGINGIAVCFARARRDEFDVRVVAERVAGNARFFEYFAGTHRICALAGALDFGVYPQVYTEVQ